MEGETGRWQSGMIYPDIRYIKRANRRCIWDREKCFHLRLWDPLIKCFAFGFPCFERFFFIFAA